MTNLEQLNETEKRFIEISQRIGDTTFHDGEPKPTTYELYMMLKGFCAANNLLLDNDLLVEYCGRAFNELFVAKSDCEKAYIKTFKTQTNA